MIIRTPVVHRFVSRCGALFLNFHQGGFIAAGGLTADITEASSKRPSSCPAYQAFHVLIVVVRWAVVSEYNSWSFDLANRGHNRGISNAVLYLSECPVVLWNTSRPFTRR